MCIFIGNFNIGDVELDGAYGASVAKISRMESVKLKVQIKNGGW